MEQYYTPALEDLHIGYQCEANGSQVHPILIDEWVPVELTNRGGALAATFSPIDDRFMKVLNTVGALRTPYLTPEQLEEEGWEHKETTDGDILLWNVMVNMAKVKSEHEVWKISLHMDRTVFIGKEITNIEGKVIYIHLFNGKCPSINEFRTICKLLNIN